MEAWVVKGTEPPPSRYPRLADGNLVDAATLPAPAPPDDRATAYQPFRVDGAEPPAILGTYKALVPALDADGNELGGVRLPFLTTPLGAYRPWNLRTPAIGFPQHRVSFFAAFLPFSKAQAAARYREPRCLPRPLHRRRRSSWPASATWSRRISCRWSRGRRSCGTGWRRRPAGSPPARP